MSARKPGFGKRLAELHGWNAWTAAALAATGLLLAWEPVRGWLEGYFRQPVKLAHIALGVLSGVLLALYFPSLGRHWRQIRKRPAQRGNLAFAIALSAGWLLSGVVLWQIRLFPPDWANGALLVHDLFTWVGVPYLLYHSATRLKWLRQPGRRALREEPDEAGTPAGEPMPSISRKQFLKGALGFSLAAAALPSFVRWLGQASGGALPGIGEPGMTGGGADANRMVPAPAPLPDSVNVVGGGAKGYFRVYTVTPLPAFDSDTWTFKIDGLVEKPTSWNWEQFLGIARTVQVSDFHCVTGWSVYRNTWEGIPLSALLQMAGVKPGAKYAKFYSGDGTYTDTLTLEQANMADALVALLHDGKPIHRDYGGPVRLIVPRMYAYKSVKWLDRIELIDREHVGYWEQRGYDADAWIRG